MIDLRGVRLLAAFSPSSTETDSVVVTSDVMHDLGRRVVIHGAAFRKALLLHWTLSTGVGYPGFQSTVVKEGGLVTSNLHLRPGRRARKNERRIAAVGNTLVPIGVEHMAGRPVDAGQGLVHD